MGFGAKANLFCILYDFEEIKVSETQLYNLKNGIIISNRKNAKSFKYV